MDDAVKAAQVRWPNVPAAFGWLSLDARGRWHLHEDGKAAEGGNGAPITSPQILQFIQRNYARDDAGRWFFQNGPQRVYVRLDAAPFILRRAEQGNGLVTHTGVAIETVSHWWLADADTLFAATNAGPGMIEDRELPYVLAALRTPDGQTLDLWLAEQPEHTLPPTLALPDQAPAPVMATTRTAIASKLGFDANPQVVAG